MAFPNSRFIEHVPFAIMNHMKLHVGERLEGAGAGNQPGGYVVTSIVRETPWLMWGTKPSSSIRSST